MTEPLTLKTARSLVELVNSMVKKSSWVRATSAFILQDRGVIEIGTELELPHVLALELVASNKAERIEAPRPAEPPPVVEAPAPAPQPKQRRT